MLFPDEPGARHPRDMPRPARPGAPRLTALEFPERGRPRRRARRPQRAEMTTRMADEIERNCAELGDESRLIRMQLDEVMEDVCARRPRSSTTTNAPATRPPPPGPSSASRTSSTPAAPRVRAGGVTTRLRGDEPARPHSATAQHRVLSRIPRLPDSVIHHVVRESLDAVVRASRKDLEAVDGVGSVRAREIREGLRRPRSNLVDRYLQL